MKKHLSKQNSLHLLPQDLRDFPLGAVFGDIDIKDVPNDYFNVSNPITIKNQGENDLCSAFGGTAVSEDQEGVELLPEYNFYKTKEISGDPEEWGANLRDACKSFCKYGSIPTLDFKKFQGMDRDLIVQKTTWPDSIDGIAEMYKKASFFSVTGKINYDTFDKIRGALWLHRNKKCSILTGCLFREEWLNSPNGLIPKQYGPDGTPHAFKIFGQKIVEGELCLMAQLSQGEEVGDRGIFYFPREVVNKEIGPYGMYMFKDMPKAEVETYLNIGIKKNSHFKILQAVWSLIKSIFSTK